MSSRSLLKTYSVSHNIIFTRTHTHTPQRVTAVCLRGYVLLTVNALQKMGPILWYIFNTFLQEY